MAQTIATTSRPAYRPIKSYRVHRGALAGLDKFTHFLTNWDQYLAPAVERCFRSLVTRSCCSSGSLRWPRLWLDASANRRVVVARVWDHPQSPLDSCASTWPCAISGLRSGRLLSPDSVRSLRGDRSGLTVVNQRAETATSFERTERQTEDLHESTPRIEPT